MAVRLMAIFSLGGPLLSTHLRPRAVRCRTGFLTIGGDDRPEVVLDPFPGTEPGARGIVGGGWARMEEGGEETGRRELAAAAPSRPGRWDDLDLLAFTGTTLWTWLALPLYLDHPEVGVRRRDGSAVEVTVPDGWPATSPAHVLHLDGEGRVVRHEERGLVHHLSGHCDFGEVNVATRRRTRVSPGVTVLWADVVAAASFPQPPSKPSTERPRLPNIPE